MRGGLFWRRLARNGESNIAVGDGINVQVDVPHREALDGWIVGEYFRHTLFELERGLEVAVLIFILGPALPDWTTHVGRELLGRLLEKCPSIWLAKCECEIMNWMTKHTLFVTYGKQIVEVAHDEFDISPIVGVRLDEDVRRYLFVGATMVLNHSCRAEVSIERSETKEREYLMPRTHAKLRACLPSPS